MALILARGGVCLHGVARRTVVPIAVIARAIFTWRPILAGAVIAAGTVVALAILTQRTVVAGPIITRTFVTGTVIARSVITGAVIAPAITASTTLLAVIAVAVFVTWAVVAVARTIIPLAIVPGTIITLLLALPGLCGGLGGFGGCGGVGCLGLCLGGLVLEVDVEARGEVVAAENFARRAVGLHGPEQAEIVFRVLQVVLGKHPVAG